MASIKEMRTEATNNAFFSARKSISYGIIRGFDFDLFLQRPDGMVSPVHEGILDHIHTRVVKPFSQKFEPNLSNQYFFRPIKFEFETNEFEHAGTSMQESIIDQIGSVLLPILTFIDPFQIINNACILTALYVASTILNFCRAIYQFSKETLTGERDYSVAVESLKETASHFLIALCMPVVGAAAAILDSVRLVTRCIATLIDLVQQNCMDSPTASSGNAQ